MFFDVVIEYMGDSLYFISINQKITGNDVFFLILGDI